MKKMVTAKTMKELWLKVLFGVNILKYVRDNIMKCPKSKRSNNCIILSGEQKMGYDNKQISYATLPVTLGFHTVS